MNPISLQILHWYEQNKRDLPWRQTVDPYKIWISEIILQQTRVDQGVKYYQRFVEKWPDVSKLAAASEQEVLKMWQGLGYYSRARNMLFAAKQIMEAYEGNFPKTATKLKSLKGIGDYTAAAIASIAFNEAIPVIDGNVYRVLSRIYSEETPIDSHAAKKVFRALADDLLVKTKAGDFNQAIMEFGALHCRPKNPDCASCPLSDACLAFAGNKVEQLPVKSKRVKIRKRFLNYFILSGKWHDECHTVLRYRYEGDVWQGLYDFPCIETSQQTELDDMKNEAFYRTISDLAEEIIPVEGIRKHVLTHQHLMARFYLVKCKNGFERLKNNSLSLVSQSKIGEYPLPRLIDQFLTDNENIFDNC
jgi:A/G-specific adenine glycosylase